MSHSDAGAVGNAAVVDEVIRRRHTTKLMQSPDRRDESVNLLSDARRRELETIIEGASWAPFHRRADETTHRTGGLSSALPWRFHVLEGQTCLSMIAYLERQAREQSDPKWARAWQSKIKDMLAACGVLIQVTWLPDPEKRVRGESERGAGPESRRDTTPVMTLGNIEHVAAAGAAVQNVLLAAEARDWKSYWSSGGILRDPDVFAFLGIGAEEALLGSLFLSPSVPESATEKPGGLREERGATNEWARWVEPRS